MANKNGNFRHVSFTLNDQDTMDFNEYYIKNTKRGRKVVWQYRMIFPAFLVGYVALMLIFKFENKYVWVGAAVLAAISVLYGLRAEHRVIETQNNEVMKQTFSLENAHPEPTTLDFGDEEVTAVYKGRSQTYMYVDVIRISRIEKAMYVWMNDIIAMQIPKRAYNNDRDRNALFDFLKEKCVNAEIDDKM